MTLLQSCLVDVLKPEEGVFHHYDLFLSRYTLITVTAIVSQCSLIPETYEGMTKADMDRDIDGMIEGLPIGSERKRDMYRDLSLAAHIYPGASVQENENRFFASELFFKDAKKHSLSNREMILRGLNSSSFMNYFFLLEDSLNSIYIDSASHHKKPIGGANLIKLFLEKIISETGIKDQFEKELYARSKFFFDTKSLELLWNLLNLIRNKLAHTNGFYDDKANLSFNERLEELAGHFSGNDELLPSSTMVIDVFDRHKDQIKKTRYLIVDDSLENIVRNISIFIMESLYACNRDKISKTK